MSRSKWQPLTWLRSLQKPCLEGSAQIAHDMRLRGWWLVFARLS